MFNNNIDIVVRSSTYLDINKKLFFVENESC